VQREPVSILESNLVTLREWLYSVIILAAELKCQRGVFEVDESVKLGELYDDQRMFDVKIVVDEENTRHAIVSAILSKGVVRRSYAGAEEVQAQICRTRVLVKIDRVEEEMEDVRMDDVRIEDGRRGDGWIGDEEMDDLD